MSNVGITEEELAAKASGPRVTKEDLEANIKGYVIFRGSDAVKDVPSDDSLELLTICLLTTLNGFTVIGQSACAYPENFDADMGARLALGDAKGKLWALMGYELKTKVALVSEATPKTDKAMETYVGTKVVHAIPMSRAVYNQFRGWDLPADEDGTDEGYLVEYGDGGQPNVEGYVGYISWSPKDVFERAYKRYM